MARDNSSDGNLAIPDEFVGCGAVAFDDTRPAFMLSGFAFPIADMPVAVQWLTYLNPLRYFVEIVRGLFLKGSGVDMLWPQMLCLAVYGVAMLAFSALRFRKTLD